MKYRYPFTNEIVFALVMQDKEICRGFLQLIFPEKKIRDLKLHEAHVDVEKTIIVGLESRKVRFDVLFEDSTLMNSRQVMSYFSVALILLVMETQFTNSV